MGSYHRVGIVGRIACAWPSHSELYGRNTGKAIRCDTVGYDIYGTDTEKLVVGSDVHR